MKIELTQGRVAIVDADMYEFDGSRFLWNNKEGIAVTLK